MAVPQVRADEHAERVRRYYDENARLFERLGPGGTRIHRAVWGPGVKTQEESYHHVDDRILALLRALGGAPRVVDLGCGLGASLSYLASRVDLRGEGITISAVQAARASELVAAARLRGQVRCREGDFLSLPADLRDSDLAFSIEAFAHSPDAGRYFVEAARVLRPGGKLVLCDDFLGPAGLPTEARRVRLLEEFRAGWQIGSLVTVAEARALAGAAGLTLVEDDDLTPHLRLRRPLDRWITLVVALGRPFRPRGSYWQNLVGGQALQRALGAGLVQYRFLVFERSS